MDWSRIVLCHSAALALGFLLDRVVGDPYWLPHPVRAIGSLIGFLDRRLMDERAKAAPDARSPRTEIALGAAVVFAALAVVGAASSAVTLGAYLVDLRLGTAVEAVLIGYLLASKSLRVECMKVRAALVDGTLQDARRAVAMIVGRDVDALDAAGIARAAVETSAENLSDGAIAPWLYAALGGPVLGWLYKGVNTTDSMLGYHNDRYEYFGKCAARLDDVVNFLPSRLSALCAAAAAFALGYDARRAWRVFRRDRFNHKSPNSAQTESVYAGALGLRLAGDAFYFGKLVKKPFIGDDVRPIEPDDIARACGLTDWSFYLCVGATLAALGAVLLAA